MDNKLEELKQQDAELEYEACRVLFRCLKDSAYTAVSKLSEIGEYVIESKCKVWPVMTVGGGVGVAAGILLQIILL